MILTVIVTLEEPATTKLPFPKADLDNYVKAVMDVCNGRLWTDDWLVQTFRDCDKVWAEPGKQSSITITVQTLE